MIKKSTNLYPSGTTLEIKSRRYGALKAVVLKYIPNNEWTCEIIDPKDGVPTKDEFVIDEIIGRI